MKEYFGGDGVKQMAETMEQYMSKTRADYGSGVARPKIEDKDNFELKGQFLNELRTNTFSGLDHEDANEHIEKVLEITSLSKILLPARTEKRVRRINNFQQEPDENLYQAWEQFKELLMKYPQHYLTEMQEVVLFYNGLDVPTRQILDSRGAIPSKTVLLCLLRPRSTETSDELAAIQAQLNNLRREIKKVNEKVYAAQVGCEQYPNRANERGPLGKRIWKFNEGGLTLKTNPRDQVKSISTIVEADASSIRRIGSHQYAKGERPRGFTLPCFINNVCFDNALADLGASVSVMPLSTYLNLGLGELAHTKLTVELADRTMKYPKGIAENVLVGIGKFVFLVDFIILDIPEDIKVPLILRRPFLSTAHAKIDVFKRKITLRVGEEKIIFKSVKPASSLIKRVYMLSLRERMELDLEARLMGETLVLNRSLDPFFEDYIELNDLNVPLELRRDQVDDLMPTIEEGGVVEEFKARNDARMVSKIFGYPSDCDHDKKIRIDCAHNLKFSCMIDFVVLEDMDSYRNEGIGDVIFGEPFLREVGINAKRSKK
ncbi:putative reverse transcriptase domain-containing protein [Tanacetum coccineum]